MFSQNLARAESNTSSNMSASKAVNIEIGHVWNNGILNDKQASTALHFGVSGVEVTSLHSSLDFGILENDRRKYLRFNVAGYGYQPRTDLVNRLGGFFRADILCLSVAETGYFALTPGIELGATLNFERGWAALMSLRQSVDFLDPHSSLTSIVFSAVLAD